MYSAQEGHEEQAQGVVGEDQPGQGRPCRQQMDGPRLLHQVVECPEDEGEEDKAEGVGQGSPQEDIGQVVGNIDVEGGGDQGGVAAAQGSPGVEVHGQPGQHEAQGKDALDCGHEVQAQQVERLAQVEDAGGVNIEQGIAVAKGEVGQPARVEDAVLERAIELHEEIDAVACVVGAPEVAGGQQRSHSEGREQDDEEPVAIKRPRHSHGAIIHQGGGRKQGAQRRRSWKLHLRRRQAGLRRLREPLQGGFASLQRRFQPRQIPRRAPPEAVAVRNCTCDHAKPACAGYPSRRRAASRRCSPRFQSLGSMLPLSPCCGLTDRAGRSMADCYLQPEVVA